VGDQPAVDGTGAGEVDIRALIRTDPPTGLREDGNPHLRALRADLEELRAFRLQQLEQLAATISSDSSFAADEPHYEVLLDLQSAATNALADIEGALERMDIGTYGLCQQCDCAIPVRRLAALPMVRLCMPCQAAEETRIRRDALRAVTAD
jgi:RNA polymerase-binding transcription factor DksA